MQINIQLDNEKKKNEFVDKKNIIFFSDYFLKKKNEKKIYFSSLIGLRDKNEDTHNIILTKDVNMYAIYDGHGGTFTSKFLSKYLPMYLLNNLEIPIKKKKIINVFNHIQKILVKKYNKHATETGSTCLICLEYFFNNKKLISIINLGDSRGVICRNNCAIPLSKDHKPSWPEEKYRIEKLNGKIYLDKYDDWRIHDLSVSRAFGDIYAHPHVCQTPDIFNYLISPKDKFVVLACDGLWDVLSNQDVINYILYNCYNDSLSERTNKDIDISKKLAEYAIKKGSTDNISIIIIFFD